MKLSKTWFVLIGIIFIVAISFFQFTHFQNQLTSSFESIIAAKVDIRQGERITADKIGLVKVAKPTPIPGTTNPADVIGKIAPYDIKKGEPIIPSKLLVSLNTAGEEDFSATVKVEPVPYSFIESGATVKLLFQSRQDQKVTQQVFDRLRVVNMYDQNLTPIQKVLQQQNTYQTPSVCYLEVSAPKDIILKLKQLEPLGSFVVLKTGQ